MTVRNATPQELEAIKDIYENAKLFMRSSGNMHQWTGDYPSRTLILRDIENGNCFVYEEDGEILGVFCLVEGPDVTYGRIDGGNWLDDSDYYVIHRIAMKAHGKGIAQKCFDYGMSKNNHLRIDTHKDNIPMQRAL
ncbi:MAG: GNAT family N-acetyltransferase, partial [Clostridia bacterium]|nr:GNAT family N-acetyltransferase [Clostridia bacterium]